MVTDDNRPQKLAGNAVSSRFRSKTAENAASDFFVRIRSNAVPKASSNLSSEEYRKKTAAWLLVLCETKFPLKSGQTATDGTWRWVWLVE